LKDFHDEEIKGTFYQSELQKVDVRDDDIWKIETMLKTKGAELFNAYFFYVSAERLFSKIPYHTPDKSQTSS
jgi:hypothetical protein